MSMDKVITTLIEEDRINIRNKSHERCIELFYPFMYSYKKNRNTIKGYFSQYFNHPLTTNYRETACFNGRFDNGIRTGADKVHLYIQVDDIRLNLYYIQNIADLYEAFKYTEKLEQEYKVLVYEYDMEAHLCKCNHDNVILIRVEDVKKFL